MKIFEKKKTGDQDKELLLIDPTTPSDKIIERPRICCIDIDETTYEFLAKNDFNVYKGSLGDRMNMPNKNRNDSCYVQLNFKFPPNIHEYDVFIIDLDNAKTIDYHSIDHIPDGISGSSYISLISDFPETIFDPRPYSSSILGNEIKKIGNRTHLIIVFSTAEYTMDYKPIKISNSSTRLNVEKYSIYSLFKDSLCKENKFGKEVVLNKMRSDIKGLFEKNKSDIIFNQTFYQSTIWKNNTNVDDPEFHPLLMNLSGDIISYCRHCGHSEIFVFPQIKDKKNFLHEFLTKIAPDVIPDIFPFSTQFSWKENQEYWLPGHSFLLKQKENLVEEYKIKIDLKDEEIEENRRQYQFLHDLVTETGDNLVVAAQIFFKWLGFSQVRIMDNEVSESKIKEEDIQIDIEDNLLIIEIKGIGGTSTDSECSQISKIKHRRCKERNRFDVFALYLVNHQRYLPPSKRKNPPFTIHQVNDALSDERGLLTTWQLFSLYHDIENGIITKDYAKRQLLNFGLVNFSPENIVFIDEPTEFFQKGLVWIINSPNVQIKIGDELLIERDEKFEKVSVVEIKVNDEIVNQIGGGIAGLKFNKVIKKKSRIWKSSIS